MAAKSTNKAASKAARQAVGGKLALVTGAGSGLGEAIATALAEAGAKVLAVDLSDDRATEVAERLRAAGHDVHGAQADVADRDAMVALAERVQADFGTLDVLVNNAGVATAGRLLDTPMEDWDWMLGVNLYGVLHGCRLFGPAMRDAPGKRHVVNIASAAGLTGLPNASAYSVAKGAVVAFSEALAAENDPAKLSVHVVCPGFFPTRIAEAGRYASSDPDRLQRAVQRQLLQPGRTPAVVAHAILDAIARDRFMVPVFREAHVTGAMRRLPLGVGVALKRRMGGKLGGRRKR